MNGIVMRNFEVSLLVSGIMFVGMFGEKHPMVVFKVCGWYVRSEMWSGCVTIHTYVTLCVKPPDIGDIQMHTFQF